MVDALIEKGLCNLGIHGMDWTYCQSSQAITLNHSVSVLQLRDVLNRVCLQDGVCRRCEAKRSRMHHDGVFEDCERCGESGSDKTPPDRYDNQLSSASLRRGLCKLGMHGMDWAYCQSSQAIMLDYPVSALRLRDFLNSVCLQDGGCRRCGVKRGNRTSHDWGEGILYGKIYCLRCGAEETMRDTGGW